MTSEVKVPRRDRRARRVDMLSDLLIGGPGALAFSAACVAVVAAVRPGYFHTDDAINEFLPNSLGIWRLISSGQLPVLNADVISGGNLLVDFGRGPFHPITVLASLGWAFGDADTVALLMAGLLLFTTISGAFLLARGGMGLGRSTSALMAVTIAASPSMVGIFMTSWWNNGVGVAGFVWAVAALLWVVRAPRPVPLIVLAVSTWALFATGWPPSYIAFAVSCVLAAAYAFVVNDGRLVGRVRVPLLAAGAVFAGVLAAIPLISEYAAVGRYLERGNGWHNADNFLAPVVGQLLAVGNPVSGDFMSVFGGYRWIAVPIGFATLLVFIAVFFTPARALQVLRTDRLLQLLLTNTAVFYLMTQLPTQLGPTRWSFRYLPYALVFLVASCFFFLSRSERTWSKTRFWLAVSVVVSGALYSSWRVVDPLADLRHSIIFPTVYVLGTSAALWLYRRVRWRRQLEAALVAFGLVLMSLQIPPQGAFFTTPHQLPELSSAQRLAALTRGGFLFDAVSGGGVNEWAPGFYSSRFLLAGARLVNGYDPVGQAAYSDLLHPVTHGMVPRQSLAVLTGPAPAPFDNTCWLTAMRVTGVLVSSDPKQGRHRALAECGYALDSTRGGTALFLKPQEGNGTFAEATEGVQVSGNVQINDREELATVASVDGGQLVFARMWWPGYSAQLNGTPLEVGSLGGVLVTVTLPPGSSGQLRLTYQPTSWAAAPALIGAGIALLIVVVFSSLLSRRRHATATAMSGGADGLD